MSDFFDKCNDHFFVAAYKMGSDTHQKNDLADFVSNPYEYEIIYDVQNELCDLSFEDKSERGLTMQEVSNCVNRRALELISAKIHEVMSGPDSPFIVREEDMYLMSCMMPARNCSVTMTKTRFRQKEIWT